jgi:hypothetical protein
MPDSSVLQKELSDFFSRDVCQRATKPLRDGIEIAVNLADAGTMTLTKKGGRMRAEPRTPGKPDMTFQVPERALHELTATTSEDIGEIGIAILKLMAHSDAQMRVTAKVHIGLFDLLRNGYLGVLPLGGAPVMKFLGSKGFNGIGKIKEAISRLRTQ